MNASPYFLETPAHLAHQELLARHSNDPTSISDSLVWRYREVYSAIADAARTGSDARGVKGEG